MLATDLGYDLDEMAEMFGLEEDEMQTLLDEYELDDFEDDEYIDRDEIKKDEQEWDYRYEKYGVLEK